MLPYLVVLGKEIKGLESQGNFQGFKGPTGEDKQSGSCGTHAE
jgi:hypothetical protein